MMGQPASDTIEEEAPGPFRKKLSMRETSSASAAEGKGSGGGGGGDFFGLFGGRSSSKADAPANEEAGPSRISISGAAESARSWFGASSVPGPFNGGQSTASANSNETTDGLQPANPHPSTESPSVTSRLGSTAASVPNLFAASDLPGPFKAKKDAPRRTSLADKTPSTHDNSQSSAGRSGDDDDGVPGPFKSRSGSNTSTSLANDKTNPDSAATPTTPISKGLEDITERLGTAASSVKDAASTVKDFLTAPETTSSVKSFFAAPDVPGPFKNKGPSKATSSGNLGKSPAPEKDTAPSADKTGSTPENPIEIPRPFKSSSRPKASDTAKKDGEQSKDTGPGLFGWSWGAKKEPEKPAGGAFNSFMKPAEPSTTPSSTFTFNNPNPLPEKRTNAPPAKDWFYNNANGDKSKLDDPVSPLTEADIQRAGPPKPPGGDNGEKSNNPAASKDKDASPPTQTPSAKALGKRPQGAPEETTTPPSNPGRLKDNTERADGAPPALTGGDKDSWLSFAQTDGAAPPPPEKSTPEPPNGPDQPSWSFGSFGTSSASASSSQPQPQPQPNKDPHGKDASTTNPTEKPKDTPAPASQNKESSNRNGADGRPAASPTPSPNPADALLLVHGIPLRDESRIKALADLDRYNLTPENRQYWTGRIATNDAARDIQGNVNRDPTNQSGNPTNPGAPSEPAITQTSTNRGDTVILLHGIPQSERNKILTPADLDAYDLTPAQREYWMKHVERLNGIGRDGAERNGGEGALGQFGVPPSEWRKIKTVADLERFNLSPGDREYWELRIKRSGPVETGASSESTPSASKAADPKRSDPKPADPKPNEPNNAPSNNRSANPAPPQSATTGPPDRPPSETQQPHPQSQQPQSESQQPQSKDHTQGPQSDGQQSQPKHQQSQSEGQQLQSEGQQTQSDSQQPESEDQERQEPEPENCTDPGDPTEHTTGVADTIIKLGDKLGIGQLTAGQAASGCDTCFTQDTFCDDCRRLTIYIHSSLDRREIHRAEGTYPLIIDVVVRQSLPDVCIFVFETILRLQAMFPKGVLVNAAQRLVHRTGRHVSWTDVANFPNGHPDAQDTMKEGYNGRLAQRVLCAQHHWREHFNYAQETHEVSFLIDFPQRITPQGLIEGLITNAWAEWICLPAKITHPAGNHNRFRLMWWAMTHPSREFEDYMFQEMERYVKATWPEGKSKHCTACTPPEKEHGGERRNEESCKKCNPKAANGAKMRAEAARNGYSWHSYYANGWKWTLPAPVAAATATTGWTTGYQYQYVAASGTQQRPRSTRTYAARQRDRMVRKAFERKRKKRSWFRMPVLV